MIIVGQQLLALNKQHKIIQRELVLPDEDFSLNLSLDPVVKRYNLLKQDVVYGQELPSNFTSEEKVRDAYLSLGPSCAVLGCSAEVVSMPLGYFGLVQTKGSLARLFVTVTCCDGQIEPGYTGKVTFELVNLGKNTVKIPIGAKIAQSYVVRCSSRLTPGYAGKYQGATGPTYPAF